MVAALLARKRALWWLAGALVVLRSAGFAFGAVDIDETDSVVFAAMMRDGGIPYVDFVEKKPLLFYLFWWPSAALPWGIWPTQVFALLWVLATCVVVGRAARRWTGDEAAGTAAMWLCAFAASCNVVSV